ncbi:MAG: IS66 family insertion sequence element accessory protein TnpB [Nitrosomonas sp.]|nr:IS66 family insertion sequence element accessory protein TnpB [Nitrosomonas sp.]
MRIVGSVDELGHPPCASSAFIFCNRAGNRIKVLLWEWLITGVRSGLAAFIGSATMAFSGVENME